MTSSVHSNECVKPEELAAAIKQARATAAIRAYRDAADAAMERAVEAFREDEMEAASALKDFARHLESTANQIDGLDAEIDTDAVVDDEAKPLFRNDDMPF